jgi:hypothetical protein
VQYGVFCLTLYNLRTFTPPQMMYGLIDMCFRSKLQDMAMIFTEAAQKNSTSDVFSPIREALHVIVHDGVAAAEATQPRQVRPRLSLSVACVPYRPG